MKLKENLSELDLEYQNLLNILDRTAKYLDGLNIDPTHLKSYKKLLRYLRSRPAETISDILRETASTNQSIVKRVQPDFSVLEILGMPIEKIIDLASNKETPRKHLEQIAAVRFGVTKGGLSVLRNRHALSEKIRTLVSNENAHESITRAASQTSQP